MTKDIKINSQGKVHSLYRELTEEELAHIAGGSQNSNCGNSGGCAASANVNCTNTLCSPSAVNSGFCKRKIL